MFRCSECGCEFDIKPDFCDCGNDVFVEITDAKPSIPQQQKKPEKKHKTFEEQYPELSRNLEKLDPISVIIFIICIILSILSFVFIKPSEKALNDTNTKIATEKPKREVKDINTFWNDTPPKAEEPKTEITIQDLPDNIESVKPVPTPVVKPSQTTVKKTTQTAPKNQVKTAQKNQPKANQNTQKKTAAQPKKTTPTQQTAQKPVNTQNQTPTKQNVTTYPPQPSVTIVTDSSNSGTKNNQTVNTQEWENYKARLRNYIGNKIDYTQIYGDGNCVVTFKISSSGKLIERKFTTLSSNTTLNDAVYAAVNSVSSYNPPPSAYNGQTLKFTVKYYNGRYSVTLK